MTLHALAAGNDVILLLTVTALICIAGIWMLFSRWGHGRATRFIALWVDEALRCGGGRFLRVLVLDVLLFRRVWRRSRGRWAVHMAMFWGFCIFGGLAVLGMLIGLLAFIDPAGAGGAVARFHDSLHVPYDLLGYVLLAGSGIALGRRIVSRKVRERTNAADLFLVGSVFCITLTGMIAEWFSGFGSFIGPAVRNWEFALQFQTLHIYAMFILFVMVLPWSKFCHILATPLTLLARRGGE
ncbi:hypothetical protein ABH15_10415 [Methanoculleus taiwanensis]|uniref:NarG-like domain-containing protein n=1 Tax=Methanoculleus taiwanensis TaxID=1550565 RepID=A0A498H3H0_9EURY|nr:hypothetical protein [Methanoculleus taiwanensis]RXE56474.1 hypothetical protein ABH15_10415 [Methanoculleus taiwanensis]